MENCLTNARLLSKSLEATGWYTCVSDIHRKKGEFAFKGVKEAVFSKAGETSADYIAGLPVVAFRLSDEFKKEFPHIQQEEVSNLLRAKQYIIPNYPLPPDEDKTEILRVVVRESMSFDLLDRLLTDICTVTSKLMESKPDNVRIIQGDHDTSAEKQISSKGKQAEQGQGKGGERPMSDGIHRTVC
jgi:glutamate decarboxylase